MQFTSAIAGGCMVTTIGHDDQRRGGSIDLGANFIFADFLPLGFFWLQSGDFGITGDWIIRATISQLAAEPLPVPALSPTGSLSLGALILGLGALSLLRRRSASRSA